MTPQAAAVLDLLSFQILFKFSLLHFKMTRKQHLAVEIHKIEISQSTHKLRDFYDDVITCDVIVLKYFPGKPNKVSTAQINL